MVYLSICRAVFINTFCPITHILSYRPYIQKGAQMGI